jgi:hypothetical protein
VERLRAKGKWMNVELIERDKDTDNEERRKRERERRKGAGRGIVFPFIIWFYGSAIVIIRGWSCGFGNSEDIVNWSNNRTSFTVLEFMAVVTYWRGI